VTLTLPESTLEGLKQIDEDRGHAIVKLTEAALRTGSGPNSQVEIVQMADNTGLLVVGPSKVLRRIAFLHLVEVAPARFVIAMDPGNDYRALELALIDELESVPESDQRERELVTQLLDQIRVLRKSARMRMAEILFVELTQKGGRAALHSLMSTLGCLLGSLA
jgi:aryl carrier-like protein